MRLSIYLFIICFATNLTAQGIHFSDNREIPMQLNPAFTAILHNDYVHRLLLVHRRQGNAILGKSEFETSYASYDRKLNLCDFKTGMFVGLGLELLHDQVGFSIGENPQYFHRQEVNFNSSLGIKLNDSAYLIAGLRLGLLSHGLKDDNLTYDSQFDGRDFNEGLSTMEEFSNERLLYFDIGAGFLFRGTIDYRGSENFIQLNTYEFGMSFMHLNNKEEKFLVNSNKYELGREYRVHGKFGFLINGNFKINPSLILYKYGALVGGNGKEWQIRPSVEFAFLKRWMLVGGLRISNFADRLSNFDALIFTLKWKPHTVKYSKKNRQDNMIVGLSFDINVSPHLVGASRHYGAFEVFFVHYFAAGEKEEVCCPWRDTENQAFY